MRQNGGIGHQRIGVEKDPRAAAGRVAPLSAQVADRQWHFFQSLPSGHQGSPKLSHGRNQNHHSFFRPRSRLQARKYKII